jgi:hypothetical protein
MANLLANGDFEEPAGAPTSLTQVGVTGLSAAPGWTTWNNVAAVTTTEILPSTAPNGGAQMLHVSTTGQECGLWQQYQPTGSGPAHVMSSVMVFVLSGQVGMGTGNGGETFPRDHVSMMTNEWEPLAAPNGVSPANEFIVYAISPGGADYYVDNASVNELVQPNPCQDWLDQLEELSPGDFTNPLEYKEAREYLLGKLHECMREHHRLSG